MEVPKLAGWVLFGKFPSLEMDDVSRGTPMTKRKPPCHTGWWFGTFFILPYIGNNNPNWRTHIFQRGGPTTNQTWLSPSILKLLCCLRAMIFRLTSVRGDGSGFRGLRGSKSDISRDDHWECQDLVELLHYILGHILGVYPLKVSPDIALKNRP